MSMSRSLQFFKRSRWHSSPRSPWNGLIAPSAMESDLSGMVFSRSMPMMRPKPRHFGQAPSGELNEKRPAVGLRRVKPVLGLVQLVLKTREFSVFSWEFSGEEIVAWPLPRVKAASSASRRRERLAGVRVRRSWMTWICDLKSEISPLSGSSVRVIFPSSRMRR